MIPALEESNILLPLNRSYTQHRITKILKIPLMEVLTIQYRIEFHIIKLILVLYQNDR